MFLDRVNIVSGEEEVRSPTLPMRLPSVIALKQYVPLSRHPRLRGSMSFSATGSPVSIAAIRPASELTFDRYSAIARWSYGLGQRCRCMC